MKKLETPHVYMMAYYEVVAYIHYLVRLHGMHILQPNTPGLQHRARVLFTPDAFVTFLREGLNVELERMKIPVLAWNHVVDMTGKYITATVTGWHGVPPFAQAHVSMMRKAAWELMPVFFEGDISKHGRAMLDFMEVDNTDFSRLRDDDGNYLPRLARHPKDEHLFDDSHSWENKAGFYAHSVLVNNRENATVLDVPKWSIEAMYVSFYSSVGGSPMFRTGRIVQRIYSPRPGRWDEWEPNPFGGLEIIVESPNDILLKGGATQRLKLRPELCFAWRTKLLPQGPLKDEATGREVKLYWD